MSIKRIIIDVDLSKLSFAEQHRISGAIAALQECAMTPYMHLEVTDVAGFGRTGPRNPRADKKAIEDRMLQPQTKIVFDYLKQTGRKLSPQEISIGISIGENSVRAQLNMLLKRNLVIQQGGKHTSHGMFRDPVQKRLTKTVDKNHFQAIIRNEGESLMSGGPSALSRSSTQGDAIALKTASATLMRWDA